MVAPSVTAVMTTINTADSATGWSTGSVSADTFIQGTGSIGSKVSNGSASITYDYSGTGSFDFSVGGANENEHIYVWVNVSTPGKLDSIANGGLAIEIGDGTNWGRWYVGGYSGGFQNYKGGWKCFVVSPNRQFDAVSGWTTTGNPGQLTAVTEFGAYFNMAGSVTGNNPNCFVDVIRVGTGLRIEDGDTSTPASWDALFSADDNISNKYGVIRQDSNVYFVQGKIFVGHDTGTTTTYFEDNNKVVIFESTLDPRDSSLYVDSDFYEIKVENNTTFTMGDVSGSGIDSSGISGITLRGQPTQKYKLDFNDSAIDEVNLYALQAGNVADVLFGDTNTLDGYLRVVDSQFTLADRISINLGTTYDPLLIRNATVSSEEITEAAIQLIEPDSLDGGEFTSLLSDGYAFSSEDNSTTETITISNHNLTSNTQYIKVYDAKTWDVVNPVWSPTITNGDTFDFATSDGYVNERFSLDLTITQSDGTAISGAISYVFEGLLNGDLPSDNIQTSDSNGNVSSNILKRQYTWDGSSADLDLLTFGDFALRIYDYGRVPYISALSVTAPQDIPVTLLADSAITESTQATAISNGSGIVVERHGPGETDTRPLKVLHYDGGTGAFAVGETVTAAPSGASGTVLETAFGDTTSGIMVVESWNGTEFLNNDTLTGSISGAAVADLSGGVESFYEEYSWVVECNTYSLNVVYDYLAARMAEDPVTATFESVIIWGEDEQSQLMYSTANGFTTQRNVNLTEGVWLANYGSGTVAFMTADDGTTFIPPQQYSFVLTGLQANSEIRIYNSSTGAEVSGVENSGTSFTYNYVYSGDISIYVVIFNLSYKEIRLTGLTLSNVNQSIPIQQQTDRVYSNP